MKCVYGRQRHHNTILFPPTMASLWFLVCISLIDCISHSFRPFMCFLQRNICLGPLSIFKLGHLFSCCCICWTSTLYFRHAVVSIIFHWSDGFFTLWIVFFVGCKFPRLMRLSWLPFAIYDFSLKKKNQAGEMTQW